MSKFKSEIFGSGWGDCHKWAEKKFHENEKRILRYTTWKCRYCSATFNHMYNYIPDVFVAMKACKVPNVCTRALPDRLLKLNITGVSMDDK